MEDPFKDPALGEPRPDLHMCIFPHLKEFLVVDLREGHQRFMLLTTADMLGGEFYRALEAEFSETLREETELPFTHLINLPLRLEEMIRGISMTFILKHLDIDPDAEDAPSVMVFVISGGALAVHSKQIIANMHTYLDERLAAADLAQWDSVVARLVGEEETVLLRINQQELAEAVHGDSPDYFTLWENRN
ncbi:MAG: hypothetical protein EXR46_10795 [Dehalococcoidia bacterium]|nr:hypothetical protein [Dehalococcoidia bacterium]